MGVLGFNIVKHHLNASLTQALPSFLDDGFSELLDHRLILDKDDGFGFCRPLRAPNRSGFTVPPNRDLRVAAWNIFPQAARCILRD